VGEGVIVSLIDFGGHAMLMKSTYQIYANLLQFRRIH